MIRPGEFAAPALGRAVPRLRHRPLFRLLGTPEASKKHVLFDSGHVPPYTEVARETIDWLDRVLGPVAPGPP